MRSLRTLSAALILSCLLSGCERRREENWVRISEAGFAVMMPGQPFRTEDPGAAIYRLEHGEEQYVVSYYPLLASEQGRVEQAFEQARNKFYTTVGNGGTVVEEHPITLEGHQGREYIIEVPRHGRVIRQRIYLTGSTAYLVGVSRLSRQSFSADAERFLNSFELPSR